MLQILPAGGGNWKVFEDHWRKTYYLGPRKAAEGIFERMQRQAAKRPRYALRVTSHGYGVFELTPEAKKFCRENCRYQTACIKRAERVLQAFQEGTI
jgi:hypothetical protein